MKRSAIILVVLLVSAAALVGLVMMFNRTPAPASTNIITSDLLSISIRDLMAPNTSAELFKRVDEDGRISLPLVGAMDARGLTLDELASRVNSIYAEKDLLPNANAQVKRLESGDSPSISAAKMTAGDHVRIRIWGLVQPSEVSQIVQQVADDGTIGLPLVDKLPVGGLTEIAAEAAIVKVYRDSNVMENAVVEVLRISDEQAKTTVTGSSQ